MIREGRSVGFWGTSDVVYLDLGGGYMHAFTSVKCHQIAVIYDLCSLLLVCYTSVKENLPKVAGKNTYKMQKEGRLGGSVS